MSVRRKMKRTTKQYIMVACICIIVMGGAAALTAIMITDQIKSSYSSLLTEARKEMEDNKRTVYVALADIMAGDYVTAENVSSSTVYATQPEETYMTLGDIGKVALINVKAGTQMLEGMLSANIISSELRELEYSVINISSNIANNDTIDVRISYPNGESYVILSKKLVKGYIPETAICFFWMNEEELLRMSAAIVDAGLYSGSQLITTKYIEPNIQKASEVTYTPSLAILSLLETDPNILERCSQNLYKDVRKSLENRLAMSMKDNVEETDWNVNSDLFINRNVPTNEEGTVVQVEPVEIENIPSPLPIEEGQSLDEQDTNLGELGSVDPDSFIYYSDEVEDSKNTAEFGN